jgi:hypothetical protein
MKKSFLIIHQKIDKYVCIRFVDGHTKYPSGASSSFTSPAFERYGKILSSRKGGGLLLLFSSTQRYNPLE